MRFPIVAPLRYRPSAENEWFDGESVNISGSGVLFRAGRHLLPLTPVEIELMLPAPVAGAAVRFEFRGQIVRALAPVSEDERTVVAATIVEYRFVRDDESEDDQTLPI